jgi:hypothetical protein
MTATEDLIRENLDDLLIALAHDTQERKTLEQQLEDAGNQLEELRRDCAEAMEWAHQNALQEAEAKNYASRLQGIEWERQRVLLLIAMELDRLEGDGTNSLALKHLREQILQIANPCPDLGRAR